MALQMPSYRISTPTLARFRVAPDLVRIDRAVPSARPATVSSGRLQESAMGSRNTSAWFAQRLIRPITDIAQTNDVQVSGVALEVHGTERPESSR